MKQTSEQLLGQLKSFLVTTGMNVKTLKRFLEVKIPENLRSQISHDKSFYSVANNGSLKFTESKINLNEFCNYIKNSHESSGFRLYPGLGESISGKVNYLFLMLARSSAPHDEEETIYYLFRNEDYTTLDLINDAVDSTVAKEYLTSYHETVLIEDKSQGESAKFKKSRFYSIQKFDEYLEDLPRDADLNNYYVKIEIGYISEIISKDHLWVYYRTQFPTDDPESHQGFTCMFRIYDYATNTPLLTTLEIGQPCPPQCGSLSW